ncbi:MAG TPA: mechanosensitive ion channel family protein [Candidatus Limnocylindrales bacterium]|nr:mechanosensitive ion channel family protein [Candidatus Limnocylindrales bacterium]
MSEHAWDTFTANLLTISVNAVEALVRVALIVAAGYVIIKLLRTGLSRLENLLIHATEKRESVPGAAGQRIKTLSSVLWTIANGFLWFIVVMIVLSQFGINVGPILAGAGVFGLAAGFGAQHLVRDLVSGFFLLLENQIRVGDTAIINGTTGLVEAVTFRTVVLRDQAGVVHVFPNGTINTLANATMDWSAYVIDVAVSYKEDTDRVTAIMRRVADEMRTEAEYHHLMLEPIEIFGVDNFSEASLTIKARFKTQPSHQLTIGREYRRRLKKAFDAEGVEMPAPARAAAARTVAATPST